ncbi:MAG: glycoside hydrolase family 2 [Acidobacteriia bacterium]|nr:glycoside hydrolase family 2 [Terriglobia bacterium]
MNDKRRVVSWISLVLCCCLPIFGWFADIDAAAAQDVAREIGPYHGSFIPGGLGLKKPFLPQGAPLEAASAWSMYCWIRSEEPLPAHTLLAGFGEPGADGGAQRYLAVLDGQVAFWTGADRVSSPATLDPGKWIMLAATFDGTTVRLYLNASEIAVKPVQLKPAAPVMQLAPQPLPWPDGEHFGGKIAQFTLTARALTIDQIRSLLSQTVRFDALPFEAGSKPWPVSTRATSGLRAPQDPATLPKSLAPADSSAPILNLPPSSKTDLTNGKLVQRGTNRWALVDGWRLAEAPKVTADGAAVSRPEVNSAGRDWLNAIVPGTVLTTLIDQGRYPDPDYGLYNLFIPETLNKQDYWYRIQFNPPSALKKRRLTLSFEGINYAAEAWLNGRRLGEIRGAFIRGIFDVTGIMEPGRLNALAVRVSPPPHPGIPHEQSVKAGAGLNGGMLCLDGPTFICTEGWDWLPGIRDRNTGIWQDVLLTATGAVKIGDIQVVTALPLPDTSHALVTITIPVRNESQATVAGVLEASFEGVKIAKKITLRPGDSSVTLAPPEFPQLSVTDPHLWWPNGYGSPELYHLKVSFTDAQGESDTRSLRFGIRELTYELTLLDKTGRQRRIEYAPTAAQGVHIVDVRYEAALESAAGYVYSLLPGAESSPAVRMLGDWRASPNLVVRVNGVRIACKGGNWGLDDSRKRVSRERLEPYVRLHRDANFTMIRNWCGQSTEEALYDLCDEYGLLIWNDFWITTQDSNLDPSDTALFLANARDTLLRFRNHPSVALWCGRNEGVPTPAINDGLDDLIRGLDGTRCYLPNSRLINLAPSGPWNHGEPIEFFTVRARGFSTELGLPSPPTIEALRTIMPESDLWPPNDTWAYHDWHSDGGGRVAPFMTSMALQLGAPANLEDFERKAQMFNYVDHRAMFEGFNAHLWAPNSGRLLWMSQPAWPSMSWQLFSHDYDTHGTFYGAKKACEPVHVQLNLPDLKTMVVNNTTRPLENISLTARVFSFDGEPAFTRSARLSVAPGTAVESISIDLPKEVVADVSFIELELKDAGGVLLSENFYWYAEQPATFRKLNELPVVTVAGSATLKQTGDWVRVTIDLTNQGASVALMNKVTLRHANAAGRVLPAYASDNYVSLLPGQSRRIEVECPAGAVHGELEIGLEGWNTRPVSILCIKSSTPRTQRARR